MGHRIDFLTALKDGDSCFLAGLIYRLTNCTPIACNTSALTGRQRFRLKVFTFSQLNVECAEQNHWRSKPFQKPALEGLCASVVSFYQYRHTHFTTMFKRKPASYIGPCFEGKARLATSLGHASANKFTIQKTRTPSSAAQG